MFLCLQQWGTPGTQVTPVNAVEPLLCHLACITFIYMCPFLVGMEWKCDFKLVCACRERGLKSCSLKR